MQNSFVSASGTIRLRFCTLCLFLPLVFLQTQLLIAQIKDSDPYKEKAGESGWGSEDVGKWAGQAGVIDENDKITSGGVGCPVIVVGKSVFRTDNLAKYIELETGERIRGNVDTALGKDGRYFALSVREKVGDESVENIVVFDNETGKQTCKIQGVVDGHLEHLKISRNNYVVTGYYTKKSSILNVYEAADGTLIKKIELSDKESLEDVLDFSSDGHYLATIVHDQMVVHQVSSSKTVATMEHPTLADKGAEPDQSRRSNSNDYVFIYAWTRGLRFSPDGNELAAFSTHSGNRIMIWDKKAKLTYHKRFREIPGAFDDDMKLEWFPDQNALMLGGNIIDRQSGKVVWAASTPFASDTHFCVYDQNTLIGRLHNQPTKLQKIPVPWDKIRKSLDAIESQVPAHIAPYQPVDVKIELGRGRGSGAEANKAILDGLSNRLKSAGMNYEEGSEHYFKLRFTEAAGETLPIREQTSRFSFGRGRDTGRKATLAKGELVIEYFVKGEQTPIWSQVIKAESGTSYNEEINQNSIRKSMLSRLQREISRMNFPYFVPVDKTISALPIIAE